MALPLQESEIRELAALWYRMLDQHAPVTEIVPLLVEDELEMRFPEATLHGLADFEGWYRRVIHSFFDELHTVKEVSASLNGDWAQVHVVVEWQASVWHPPAPSSARITLDADQCWLVRRSAATGRAAISRYHVNELRYHQGSALL